MNKTEIRPGLPVQFGVSTSPVQQIGVGLGALSTTALLHAAVGSLSRQHIDREARLQRKSATAAGDG